MNVPLLDLKAQYQSIKAEIIPEVMRVMESQYFILGPDVDRLEKSCAEYLNVKYALGVSSGTDALLLALMALDVGHGDAIIVPTFSFFATAGVVSRLGAEPVFVDIDPVTFNLDPAALETAIEECRKKYFAVPKAIIPVHLFGQSAEMDAIMQIAQKHKIAVVEDAAQAIGTEYKDGRKIGAIGTIGCFSFFPSKNLGGFGDGGLVTTNDDALFHKMKIMRVHGGEPKYYHKVIGGNFRLDALQAVVLSTKLPHLDAWTQGRRKNAAQYNRLFIEAGLAEETGRTQFDAKNKVLLPASIYEHSGSQSGRTPSELPIASSHLHIYNQYCIRVQNRDGLIAHLRANHIGCEIYYPVPFHKQECFVAVPSSKNVFPHSDSAASTILALPIYPELTEEMQRYVVERIRESVQ